MPKDEADEADPMEMVAQPLPDEPGAMERMAEAMVDEYLRFGFDRARTLALFRDPFFALTHAVWREKGEAWCAALVDEVHARYRRV